ncbi:MAG: outer membrane protein assembly factor BamB family protein [Planctomycetaceae bacterium]
MHHWSIVLLAAVGLGCAEQGAVPAPVPRAPAVAGETAPSPAAGASDAPQVEREGEDWPVFLGPRGTGVSGETGLLTKWPSAGPPLLWKLKIGEGYAAPAVLGNRVVLFHRPLGPRGESGSEEVVECRRVDTSEPIWRFSYPTQFVDPYGYNGGPRCSPVLSGNRCYTFGAAGMLTCLDLETGAKVWQRDTAAAFRVPQSFFGVGATPIVEDDLLIVMVGGHPRSGVVAFDAASGKTVWESVGVDTFPPAPVRIQRDLPPEKLASYATPFAATIAGKRHLLCLMRPGLVSLDPRSGAVNFSYWFRSTIHDSVNAARPLVVDDTIFLSAAYETGAALVRVGEGGNEVKTVWAEVDAMQNHWSTCIHHGGYVYGFSGRHEPGSSFRCIELATGRLMWQTQEDLSLDTRLAPGRAGPKYYGRGSAILAENHFIVLGERGTLALVELNPRKFREISRANFPELGYPCWTAPVLSRKRLLISGAREAVNAVGRHSHEYHVMCFDLARRN